MGLTGWDRFRLLNYQAQSDIYLKSIGFYQQIDNFIRTQPVLPCADGTFRNYNSVRILPAGITKLITELARQADFPELLDDIPADLRTRFNTLFLYYSTERAYTAATLINRIEDASAALYRTISPNAYAGWLAAVKTLYPTPARRMLKVLYNDKCQLTETSVSLFTPSAGSKITIPAHVKIEYLHPELYRELIEILNPNDPTSRRLKQELENFAEIESFEPVPVLREIISTTKNDLGTQGDLNEQRRLVQEMMASLFGYYIRSDKAKNTELRILDIPVINASGGIATARETFLSDHYHTGRLRNELFGNMYGVDELITVPSELGIADQIDTERFLVDFIGVQRFVALGYYDGSTKFDRSYQDFVFAASGGRPQQFREARISCTYIRNYNALKSAIDDGRLSPEQFIAWICVDDEVRELVNRPGETKFEYVNNYQAHGSFPHVINLPPAYIHYQLIQMGGFSNFVLDTDNIDYLNPFYFDVSAPCLHDHDITTDRIREAQRLAGAKNTFGDLHIDRIADILRSMREKDPLGKHARKIYQLCANLFRDKKRF